jgi:hypothetical protein
MAVRDFQDLFQQASTQLNFLLLSQRNMILIFAFAITFVAFTHPFRRRFMVWLIMFLLLGYALAVGIVSSIDYLDYMNKTKTELEERQFDDGLDLLDNWRGWVNFTYALIALNGLVIIFYLFFELDIYLSSRKTSSSRGNSSSKSAVRRRKASKRRT